MLVKTPAIKLGVEIREAKAELDKIVLAGVANAMPCTVEVSGREAWRLLGRMIRFSIFRLMLKSILPKRDE